MALLLLTLLLSPLVLGSGQDIHPQVETQYGTLRGKTLSVKEASRKVHGFYGVPFAKPPVGRLRFAPPEPPESWNSVREAQKSAALCPQNVGVLEQMTSFFKTSVPLPPLSEDCLYLNVFTPADREKESKLPVMAYIHGGGLRSGGADMFEGSPLSAFENVAVVSIQYRLGFLGFYSTGDKRAAGNYGFLDQIAALKWIQNNIANFGGDPNLVTIFGESAGAVSVSVLLMSPMSKGLFHRAIAESGVALIPHLLEDKTQDLTFVQKMVSDASACDLASLMDCLRDKSEDEMSALSSSVGHLYFPGRIDGQFLHKSALELLTDGAVASVPFIIGVNNHEFGFLIPEAINITGLKDGIPRDHVRQILGSIGILARRLLWRRLGVLRTAQQIRRKIADLRFKTPERIRHVRQMIRRQCAARRRPISPTPPEGNTPPSVSPPQQATPMPSPPQPASPAAASGVQNTDEGTPPRTSNSSPDATPPVWSPHGGFESDLEQLTHHTPEHESPEPEIPGQRAAPSPAVTSSSTQHELVRELIKEHWRLQRELTEYGQKLTAFLATQKEHVD